MSDAVRVLIADDHPLILDGLSQLFETEPGFEVIARCRDGMETIDRIARERPRLSIVDLRMPAPDGLEVFARTRDMTTLILLTAQIDDDRIIEAFDGGIPGIILKERAAEQLLECAARVLAGERWIDPDVVSRANEVADQTARTSSSRSLLSPRELEITRCLAEGIRNREIADRLFISEGTVKTHLRTIFEKVGVETRLALVTWARKEGIV